MIKRKVNPPVVIRKNCMIGCDRCVAVCPSFVLEIVEAKSAVVRGGWCIGCGHCGAVCPTGAILHEGGCFDLHPKTGRLFKKTDTFCLAVIRVRPTGSASSVSCLLMIASAFYM